MTRRWLFISTLLFIGIFYWLWQTRKSHVPASAPRLALSGKVKDSLWREPDTVNIPQDAYGDLIRYGRELIRHTAVYFGPRGSVGHLSNGMNCQNCHLEAGTRPWAGNFGAVAAIYPRFSERRGGLESVNQRISDCFERSLNGRAPDSNSREMQAMRLYILWLGKAVKKGSRPPGSGLEQLAFMDRPADPEKGKLIYQQKCARCHATNGNGQPDSLNGYKYPPLWGDHSYNTSAGLYRLTKFAGFIKDNMPYGSDYANEQLSLAEAWDLAAFVNSQPRPVKKFRQDWPNILLKPADLPEGPYPDAYPAGQHKFGPFKPIIQAKKDLAEHRKN